MWDGVDRRRFARAEYPCLITLRKSTPPPQAILTHTMDIGVFGVRVIITKKLEVMTEVDIELDLKDTLPTVISKGVIKWVRQMPSGEEEKSPQYVAGIQFAQLPDVYRKRIQKIVEHVQGKSGK